MKITPQPVLLLLCKTVETMKQVKRKICHIVLLKKKVNLAYGSVVNTISNLKRSSKIGRKLCQQNFPRFWSTVQQILFLWKIIKFYFAEFYFFVITSIQ